MREKQRRPQIVHQPVVEELSRIGCAGEAGQDRAINGDVALTAAGGDDHVHLADEIGLALGLGVLQRKSCRISADTLPRLHLALIALLGNLLVEIDRNDRMRNARSEGCQVGRNRGSVQALPVRLQAFTKAGHNPNSGNDNIPPRVSH